MTREEAIKVIRKNWPDASFTQLREALETHAMWLCISALGVKPFMDGNQWCFLYGENIQYGICGFGKTIFEAALDFYTNIKTEEAR